MEPSKLEDQTSIWAGYEQDIIPHKVQTRWFRNFRHQLFYVYRRLFSIVFLANFGVFLWVAIKGASTTDLGKAVMANVTLAVVMRQDYVIDAFFVTFTAVPRSWPMAIRKVFALVYHLGGLHSGGGVSAVMWHILFCVKATHDFIRKEHVGFISISCAFWLTKASIGLWPDTLLLVCDPDLPVHDIDICLSFKPQEGS